jgi:fructosamine-3-kinase
MVNKVEEWLTDGTPSSMVAKVSERAAHGGFRNEFDTMAWYRANTSFPVPEPYAYVSDAECFSGTVLLMEKLPGRHLGAARQTMRGNAAYQLELAQILADLHDHKRDTYGNALKEEGQHTWLEGFRPRIRSEFDAVADRLSSQGRKTVTRLLDNLDTYMPECGDPTLVHGDLWATNIIVDDTDPNALRITGFVDGSATYTDVEYELAYLRVFNAAGLPFFRAYVERHALRDGFEERCRIYWLNTMLLHVRVFGPEYLPRTEHIAREIATFL